MNTKLNYQQDWIKLAKESGWSVNKMAKLCKVSIRALELYSLKMWGKTPKKWLAEQRQKQAMELLCDGSSVKETAAKLGYKYAHHFSRQFKDYWGHCPTQINFTTGRLRVLV